MISIKFLCRALLIVSLRRVMAIDPKLSKKEAIALWQQLDPRGVGSIEIGALHSYLADRYGKVTKAQYV